jgi:DNA-binding MarR family transcriptional regulator
MQREQLIEAIFDNMHQMQRAGATKFHSLAGELGVSPSQMDLLVAVKHLQPVSAKNIAAHMRLTPGAVTQLMEGLVEKGYLERTLDERDHRIANVCLAERGIQKFKDLWSKRKAVMRETMNTLTTEELSVTLRVQEKMLEQIELRNAETKK